MTTQLLKICPLKPLRGPRACTQADVCFGAKTCVDLDAEGEKQARAREGRS